MANPRALIALLGFAVAPQEAAAHGRMTQPRARNGNANGAVGGGPSSVHSGGRYLHGICGDAPGGSQTYNRVGTVQETFVAGQSAEFKVAITAHHMGFFEFELCDDAGNISEECFAEHRLLKENCECSSSGQCDACRRWWKPLMNSETSSWVARDYQGPVIDGHYLNVVEFTMRYTIPGGVQTSNGVIRWHYVTTNSCTSQSSAPEEFWNCADVAITDGGSAGGAISFDNSALASEQPVNLRPAINDGSLAGVYSGCPASVEGALQGVGAASDYANDCGISGQGCSGSGGEVVDGSGAGGAAGPVVSPTPAPAGSSPTPSAPSGNACVAVPGNSQAATDEHCAPCATGQSWWPCTVAGLCQCAGGSAEPEPEPEPEPESEHSTEPSASPTPSPATATGQGEGCSGALNGPCSGCLATTNNVCYTDDVDSAWCADRAGIGFVWCGAPALMEARRAKTRRHAFLGTALLQAASPRSRLLPSAEL